MFLYLLGFGKPFWEVYREKFFRFFFKNRFYSFQPGTNCFVANT